MVCYICTMQCVKTMQYQVTLLKGLEHFNGPELHSMVHINQYTLINYVPFEYFSTEKNKYSEYCDK